MGIYFDHAATSYPKPEPVYRAVDHNQRHVGANPGRGAYRRALEAEQIIFKTRRYLGDLFNIPDVTRIVFTANVTESLNLALKGLLRPGDHVITSQMEHNAMWRPLKVLERERGISVSVLPCTAGRSFELADLEKQIRPATRLVAICHASNVTGTLMPVGEAGEICRRRKLALLVDAAQTAGVYPVDVKALNISLLAFTGHKGLLGPTGTGGLYIAPGIELKPLKEGGTGGDSLLEHQPAHLPDRFEAGTMHAAGIAGLGAAVKFILDQGVPKIREHEMALTAYAMERLRQIPGLLVYGPGSAVERTAVLSFNFTDTAPEEVAYVLDEVFGIMVRSGLHCAPQAHRSIGTAERGAVRVSFGYFNRKEEIDQLVKALAKIAAS